MKFWLGLLALILRALRILVMIMAYVVVSIAEQLERAGEWVDRKRGIPIVQVGVDDPEPTLRGLVDLVWQTATDSKEVPSHTWADELIERWRGGV